MKNAGKAIRDAYTSLLQGITYNSKSVPLYDIVPIGTLPDNYIQILDITEVSDDNNQKFVTDVIVTVDVITKQYKKVDRDVVDAIAEDVCDAIQPNIAGALTNTDFQIINLTRDGFSYLSDLDADYHITRKILRFKQTLIEK